VTGDGIQDIIVGRDDGYVVHVHIIKYIYLLIVARLNFASVLVFSYYE